MTRWLVCLLLIFVLGGACYCQNPYCVAGSGMLTKLGMPAGCIEYEWSSLRPNNLANMVRPCKYAINNGYGGHLYCDYHETTDTIDNPTTFATWVTAHPGKIWIIGNEPNLSSQDGLTQDQYANMFHCYYTFIKNLDPTAQFCIGAHSGGSTTAGFNWTIGWYQGVLDLYRSKFGVTMPVDVWNVHHYCDATQIEDPDKPINEFVTPFVNWCHTLESGAYAGCPIWITETPIGTFSNDLTQENVIWFMQRYMPRLELTGVSRFFWFVSHDWLGQMGGSSLTRNGVVTDVGTAYAAMASSYPNAVIPVSPYVPDPTPSYYACDFSGPISNPWIIKAGNWGIDAGTLRQTGIWPANGTTGCLQYVHQDLGVSFKMKVNAAPNAINWGGMAVRVAGRFHQGTQSGYLLFVRQNGGIGLNYSGGGTVVELAGGVDHPENWHTYRMLVVDNSIKVWVDDVLKIDYTDADRHYTSGYTIVQVYKTDSSYDDFHVLKYPTPMPAVIDDGTYTTDLSHIHAVWSAGDPGCGISGYRYAVGTSSGATDVIDWTYTTETSVSAALTLTPGTKYYVSAKAVYPDGFESSVANSDGITAAVGCASMLQAKSLPGSTYVLMEGKVVSGVFAGWVYIQEPRGIGGIRVNGTLPLQVGDVVTLAGRIGVDGQEAVLTSATVANVVHGTPPNPLFMTNRATGGGAVGLQSATIDSAGVFATGLSPSGLS